MRAPKTTSCVISTKSLYFTGSGVWPARRCTSEHTKNCSSPRSVLSSSLSSGTSPGGGGGPLGTAKDFTAVGRAAPGTASPTSGGGCLGAQAATAASAAATAAETRQGGGASSAEGAAHLIAAAPSAAAASPPPGEGLKTGGLLLGDDFFEKCGWEAGGCLGGGEDTGRSEGRFGIAPVAPHRASTSGIVEAGAPPRGQGANGEGAAAKGKDVLDIVAALPCAAQFPMP